MTIPTVTILLSVIDKATKAEMLKVLNKQIGASEDVNYFSKARDRLMDKDADGKITLPVSILTGAIRTALKANIKTEKDKAKKDKIDVHPHILQTEERLSKIKG